MAAETCFWRAACSTAELGDVGAVLKKMRRKSQANDWKGTFRAAGRTSMEKFNLILTGITHGSSHANFCKEIAMKARKPLLIALCLASSAMSAQAQMQPGPSAPASRSEQNQQPNQVQPPTSNTEPPQTPTQPAMPENSNSSQVQPASSGSSASIVALTQPEPKTENGVTYLCGGVGLDESASMKQQAGNYDLMLTFAARDGSYLADANVDIADARGRPVLQTTCGAPILLVDLPKGGTYRIRSEIAGYTQTKTVNVQNKKGSAKSLVMVWPSSVVEQEQSVGSSGSSR
jgi:hypothetical protein